MLIFDFVCSHMLLFLEGVITVSSNIDCSSGVLFALVSSSFALR